MILNRTENQQSYLYARYIANFFVLIMNRAFVISENSLTTLSSIYNTPGRMGTCFRLLRFKQLIRNFKGWNIECFRKHSERGSGFQSSGLLKDVYDRQAASSSLKVGGLKRAWLNFFRPRPLEHRKMPLLENTCFFSHILINSPIQRRYQLL